MKKKIISIVTKVVGFALALTLSAGVPVNTAHAVHSSFHSSYGPYFKYNEFTIIDCTYAPEREIIIDYKDGSVGRYMFVFITYDGSTLEIYDWDTGRRLEVVKDALLKRTILEK